jgi:hypothetical protein
MNGVGQECGMRDEHEYVDTNTILGGMAKEHGIVQNKRDENGHEVRVNMGW